MNGFEWHEDKRLANIEKHGIDFVDAIKVFSDPNRLEFVCNRDGEKRIQTIGKIDDIIIIFVVCTNRDKKIRVISARRASKKERMTYCNLR